MNNKDHFVPRFYLKKWCIDGFLQCSRIDINSDDLIWKPFATKGVGYKRGLYQEQEGIFYKPLDTACSRFVAELLNDRNFEGISQHNIGEENHELWAKFVLAQIVRIPEKIDRSTKQYKHVPDELVREGIVKASVNENAVSDLRKMVWVVGELKSKYELITGDNPVIFSPNNLLNPECFVLFPLSPKHFFLATYPDNIKKFPSDADEMVKCINRMIYSNSHSRVFARDPSLIVGVIERT